MILTLFVVHAFKRHVAQTELRPDRHAVEMSAKHPGELLERLEPAVAGPPEPLQEMPAGPGGAAVGPEAAEIVFEEVGETVSVTSARENGRLPVSP
jgi:hypothetical protein